MSCCLPSFAQNEEVSGKKRLPFFGYVMTGDSLYPVCNTHVISKMGHCGTITNRNGEFAISALSTDTLWVSCLGYARQLVPVDSTMVEDTLFVKLECDTIMLGEVTILPFNDYKTFKEMFLSMPTAGKSRDLLHLEKELNELWLSHMVQNNNSLSVITSPVQAAYESFNKSARRQARLRNNRRMYNEVLREQGRTNELLPDSLDFSIDYRLYELDEPIETGNPKALVPRQKYSFKEPKLTP